jgi:ubiquinone/menaquinone biosynthesis C-methylase UbiE
LNGRLYEFFGRFPERKGLAERRARLVGDLEGDVLEVGAGTGFTLPHYRKAGRIVAVEPDPSMARPLRERAGTAPIPVEVIDAAAEELPFADASFDHVVCALVLCSVRDPDRALAEIRRVLKPSGSLVFLEHVRGGGRLARWQDRLTPLQSRLFDGCHLNRDTANAIERAGFRLAELEPFELPGAQPLARPAVQGVATRTSS